jgi:hypothetical protein
MPNRGHHPRLLLVIELLLTLLVLPLLMMIELLLPLLLLPLLMIVLLLHLLVMIELLLHLISLCKESIIGLSRGRLLPWLCHRKHAWSSYKTHIGVIREYSNVFHTQHMRSIPGSWDLHTGDVCTSWPGLRVLVPLDAVVVASLLPLLALPLLALPLLALPVLLLQVLPVVVASLLLQMMLLAQHSRVVILLRLLMLLALHLLLLALRLLALNSRALLVVMM